MNDCNHKNVSKKKRSRSFLGEKMNIMLSVCNDCDAEFWGKKEQEKYSKWINELHAKKRHLFQIQYGLTDAAAKCLKELESNLPVTIHSSSLLIRSLIMIHMDIVEQDEWIQGRLETYLGDHDYEILIDGKKNARKVQMSVIGMQEVVTAAQMANIKPRDFVELVLSRMLLIFINEDPKMKKFWRDHILAPLTMILKAA